MKTKAENHLEKLVEEVELKVREDEAQNTLTDYDLKRYLTGLRIGLKYLRLATAEVTLHHGQPGGKARTQKKASASRRNGKLGGRPKRAASGAGNTL